LVRRKLAIILVVDGEEDPTISLRSLVSATRRIEEDFGTTLSLFDGRGPERLLIHPDDHGYPADVRYAQAPFVVGRLTYADKTEGVLIYIKATLIKGIDFTTAGYLASNPAFPHQSTIDQFFTPDQFDAYRYLGYEIALQSISSLDLKTTIASPKLIITKYCT
jgi:hypothetical protein